MAVALVVGAAALAVAFIGNDYLLRIAFTMCTFYQIGRASCRERVCYVV